VSRLSASTAGTREIGLRRAVGASRLAVAFFFMVAVELLGAASSRRQVANLDPAVALRYE